MATKNQKRPKRHQRQLGRPTDDAVARAVAVMVARKRDRPADDLAQRIHKAGGSARSSRTYREALDMLASAVRRTRLVTPDAPCGVAVLARPNVYLYALAQIAARFECWRRPPTAWNGRQRDPRSAFGSLLRHVLCDYSPPRCLEAAWFNPCCCGARERRWFLAIGQGQSVRTVLRDRFNVTRREAHLLAEAPRSMTVGEAVDWSRYRAGGASSALAERIVAALANRYENDDGFRGEVAAWIVREPGVRPTDVRAIVDYVYHRRYQPIDRLNGEEWVWEPAEPNLSMHGRTLASIMRQADRLNAQIGREARFGRPRRWASCGIPGFERTEGARDPERWIIEELRTSDALAQEGDVMNHCAGTYASQCVRRTSAVYSMSHGKRNRRRRRVTIEVDPRQRQIVQVSRRSNLDPTAEDMRIVREWADAVELSISEWVRER